MRELESWVLGYLVNSLWQVPVVFAAAWVAARMARRVSARAEHRVWVAALLLEVVLPACSVRLSELVRAVWGMLRWGAGAAGGDVRVAVGAGHTVGSGVLQPPAVLLAGVAVLYGSSLLYFAGRLGWGLWRTSLMRRRAEGLELTGEAARSWERYGRLFGVNATKVAVAKGIRGPVTVGLVRGMMLVPPGFVEGVADADLDAVFAHELAHMRRRDFAKNVLYELVSLPVAFHPVVWLTRARVAESREMVCDAMAADAVAGRERYARSLLRLASVVASGTPGRTLHAIGIFDANIFERRVMSLTKRRVEVNGVRRLTIAAGCVVVGLATCASALALRLEVAAPVVQSSPAPEAHAPARVPARVMAGNVLTHVPPVYPAEAKQEKIQGAVVMEVVIGKDGTIHNLEAISGPNQLKASAMDAVRQWTYKPYLLNGEPTEVQTTVTVTYSLAK